MKRCRGCVDLDHRGVEYRGELMTLGTRLFVLFMFAALSLSFFATTLTLASEFWDDARWVDFLAIDSHLFIFFPTFAIIALIAFYVPSCALVDLYWHHVRFGRVRFTFGFLVFAAAAWGIASGILSSPNKPIWEIDPASLRQDKGEPPGCAAAGTRCKRLPFLHAVTNLRAVSQQRTSLKPFVRTCLPDPLIDRNVQLGPKRFCIASTPLSAEPLLTADAQCCQSQEALVKAIRRITGKGRPASVGGANQMLLAPLRIFQPRSAASTQSLTGQVHALLLPLKVFFLLILLAISLLLTLQYKGIQANYKSSLAKLEIGVLIGTFATLFFPLMSQAFLFSNEALVGEFGFGTFSRIVPTLSFLFGVWTLLIILFFYRERDKEVELLGKISGAAAGVVALVQYESIVGFLVLAVGSGAKWYALAFLAGIALMIALLIMWLIARPGKPGEDGLSQSA